MTPVDTFLQSVRAAFKPTEGMPAWVWAVALLGGLALAVLARWWARRAHSQHDQMAFAQLLLEKRVPTADAAEIVRWARAVAVTPLAVISRLEAFERATARALAGQSPPPPTAGTTDATAGDDVFARVRRLRRELGFHIVPDHLPLLTTRELVPGMNITVDHVAATVIEVNEGWFCVVARDAPFKPRAPGMPTFLTLTRGRDASYQAHCATLSVDAAGAVRRAFFLHDEKPLRQQLRAAVRVAAEGTLVLGGDGAHAPPAETTKGTLVDISVGGCAVEMPAALPVGHASHVSITWDGETYRALPATVLQCDARGGGFLVRLAFHGLSVDDDTRLSAAVARHSGRPTGTT